MNKHQNVPISQLESKLETETKGTFTRREGFERWVISLHGDRELLELMVLSHYKV